MSSREFTSIFGLRLREARLRTGLPQDKLGIMIGIDESAASARISRYESGIHTAPYEISVKLAKALRVPTAYLYCDDNDLAEVLLAWGGAGNSRNVSVRKAIGRVLSEMKPEIEK